MASLTEVVETMDGRNASKLLVILLALGFSAPAMALPAIYTDRETFNSAIGEHTLLTFDTFEPTVHYGTAADSEAIYANVFRVAGDSAGMVDVYRTPGVLHDNGYPAMGMHTTVPVDALGFDIVPLSPSYCNAPCETTPHSIIAIGGFVNGYVFELRQPQFLGFRFSVPTIVAIENSLFGGVNPFGWTESRNCSIAAGECVQGNTRFNVDNIAIKIPEPSSLLLLLLSFAALTAWRLFHCKAYNS
jgi:hypothetical protein